MVHWATIQIYGLNWMRTTAFSLPQYSTLELAATTDVIGLRLPGNAPSFTPTIRESFTPTTTVDVPFGRT